MNRPVRVLSIDGGGIRGYIPALVLAEVERRSGVHAKDLFDIAVGTSTGAIISLGLAAGISAAELAQFYPTYGSRIFGSEGELIAGRGSTLGEQMENFGRFIGAPFGGHPDFGGNARHSAVGLEGVLRDVLGDRSVSDASIEVAVTSFDADSNQPVVISRRDARIDPRFDMPLWAAARATSAAPTYLPPFVREWAGRTCRFIDGGVWANNPAGVALAESIPVTTERGLTGQSVVMLSLGTGVARSVGVFDETAGWLGSAHDLVKMATATTAGQLLAVRALSPSRLTRLQVEDDRVAGKMDDPSEARLAILKSATDDLLAQSGPVIDGVVKRLLAG
jgi:patatin-like phospholipase/acyl hydrolase